MRREPTIEEFFADENGMFLQVGELQLLKERISALKNPLDDGLSDDLLRAIERMENTAALLYRLIEERSGGPLSGTS